MLELEIEILEAKAKNLGYKSPLKKLKEVAEEERVKNLKIILKKTILEISVEMKDKEGKVAKNDAKISSIEGKIANLKKEIREMTNPVQVSQPIRAGKKIDTYDFKMIIFGITFKNR